MRTVFRAAAAFDGHRHLGATDVLVENGRIAAVGHGLRGDEVVDAAFLSPGFTDAHVHPIQGGLERLRCDLSELGTREEYLTAIRSYADAHPDREWILGGGWAMPAFPGGTPLASDLDAVRRICMELPVAGIDVVEVSPPYDHAEITAYLANRVLSLIHI